MVVLGCPVAFAVLLELLAEPLGPEGVTGDRAAVGELLLVAAFIL